MPLTRLRAATLLGALLLAGCAGANYPYGMAPGDAGRDAQQALRGHPPQARTIYREGPVTGRDGDLSPEEAAREEAITYCGGVGMDARTLDVRRERLPARNVFGRSGGEYERVQFTFVCERGSP